MATWFSDHPTDNARTNAADGGCQSVRPRPKTPPGSVLSVAKTAALAAVSADLRLEIHHYRYLKPINSDVANQTGFAVTDINEPLVSV
jgi:hypothetical protein